MATIHAPNMQAMEHAVSLVNGIPAIIASAINPNEIKLASRLVINQTSILRPKLEREMAHVFQPPERCAIPHPLLTRPLFLQPTYSVFGPPLRSQPQNWNAGCPPEADRIFVCGPLQSHQTTPPPPRQQKSSLKLVKFVLTRRDESEIVGGVYETRICNPHLAHRSLP